MIRFTYCAVVGLCAAVLAFAAGCSASAEADTIATQGAVAKTTQQQLSDFADVAATEISALRDAGYSRAATALEELIADARQKLNAGFADDNDIVFVNMRIFAKCSVTRAYLAAVIEMENRSARPDTAIVAAYTERSEAILEVEAAYLTAPTAEEAREALDRILPLLNIAMAGDPPTAPK